MDGLNESKFWLDAVSKMIGRVTETRDANLAGFPHYGDQKTREWITSPDGFWTGGFWVGELWLAARLTGDASYSEAARGWLKRLEPRIDSRSVFRGFLFYYSAVTGAVLQGDALSADMAARAAKSVSGQFDPIAGLIPLGAEAEEAHTVGDGEANIDGMMAVPLLLWAARHCGDDDLRKIALAHAYKSEEFFIRPDGGVIQSASFDTKTGDLTRRYTHKGFSDASIWTRAQAWAMLTYAIAASQERGESNLLRIAEKVADWWLSRIPKDLVAYWDFDAPLTPDTRRDTSGTAIAAAALLKLASIHPDNAKAARYATTARETARALVQQHLTSTGILANGCFDPKNNKAVANELIWGDYLLMETIARFSGKLAVAI